MPDLKQFRLPDVGEGLTEAEIVTWKVKPGDTVKLNDTIAASVEKTGRLVVVHEATTFLGMGAEVAARLTERCFYHLEAPVLRVGGYNLPYPPSKLEEEFLPDLDRVLDAVDRSLAY